jgi:hypothetical protein
MCIHENIVILYGCGAIIAEDAPSGKDEEAPV